MYTCILVNGDHVQRSVPVVLTIDNTTNAVTGAEWNGTVVPINNVSKTLTNHFKSPIIQFHSITSSPSIKFSADEIYEASQTLDALPGSKYIDLKTNRQFDAAAWIRSALGHMHNDPNSYSDYSNHLFDPMYYAGATGKTQQESVQNFSKRFFPTTWFKISNTMTDSLGSNRFTDL